MSIGTTTGFTVYRFHDQVAFHTDNCNTIYMDSSDARAFADAIASASDDIDSGVSFVRSSLGTIPHGEQS